jgi:adenylosuccinate synthase
MTFLTINNVDVVCGLAWGDEAKGKIVSELLAKKKYDWVCRWSGGSNAGHTIYIGGKKYVTHIVPAGVFYGIPSYIGPDCYVNIEDLDEEMNYLKNHGFNTDLIKISPKCHVITSDHKNEDCLKYKKQQGSTGKGIAPCAKDKFGRIGSTIEKYMVNIALNTKVFNPFKHISNEQENHSVLYGDILCEGAQGFWLDINYGNYPYVTSSSTLPYSCCSLGFPPQKIRHIYGASKIYDTRVGIDPSFPNQMDENPILQKIGDVGEEFGATTGRSRQVYWLNLDKLTEAINISGCTHLIVSKTDILDKVGTYQLKLKNQLIHFETLVEMKNKIQSELQKCQLLQKIIFSDSPESVDGL